MFSFRQIKAGQFRPQPTLFYFVPLLGSPKILIFGESRGNCALYGALRHLLAQFAEGEELLPRVELGTSSLPRMRSTTELKQHKSGKRDSNPRPPAWKASALSTELFPQIAPSIPVRGPRHNLLWWGERRQWCALCRMATSVAPFAERVGADGFEPPKLKSSRFTVCPIWPLWNTPSSQLACDKEMRCSHLGRRGCSSQNHKSPLCFDF